MQSTQCDNSTGLFTCSINWYADVKLCKEVAAAVCLNSYVLVALPK